ncbi:hypothetical protein TWF694_001637 [Orbilia ellipsospora]|uniref:Uncharacterized protein n=1 Tax=Orbilia ellipsospora TaxID=2528407 RepID=A0AAV9X338_9PEZI
MIIQSLPTRDKRLFAEVQQEKIQRVYLLLAIKTSFQPLSHISMKPGALREAGKPPEHMMVQQLDYDNDNEIAGKKKKESLGRINIVSDNRLLLSPLLLLICSLVAME